MISRQLNVMKQAYKKTPVYASAKAGWISPQTSQACSVSLNDAARIA